MIHKNEQDLANNLHQKKTGSRKATSVFSKKNLKNSAFPVKSRVSRYLQAVTGAGIYLKSEPELEP
jgi:hypothetical protein